MSAVARSVAVPIGAACAGAWRDKPYRETLTLHDGWHVNLRPIHRSDASALRDFFFGSLSPRTRLMRFHGVVNVLPDDVLRALATQQPHRRVALVALTTTDDGVPRLLAEARYVVGDAGEAEFAEDHIPGAINCPVLNDRQRAEDRRFGDIRVAALPLADVLALGEHYGQGRKFVLVAHDWGGAVAWAVAMPALAPGRTYQMWLIPKGGAPRPAGRASAGG